MMSKNKNGAALSALHRANPRRQPGFDRAVAQGRSLHEQIVTSPVPGGAAGDRAAPRAPRTRPGGSAKRLGLYAAGAVIAAVIVAVVLAFGSGDSPLVSPAYAAEAVKKAAADTSAAAYSGVIDTEIVIDGEAQVRTTFAWNGDDVSLVDRNNTDSEVRYVGGLYFETYGYSVAVEIGDTEHAGQWVHVTGYDHGAQPANAANSAVEIPNPAQWLAAARTDLTGSGLLALVTGATGYKQSEGADGAVTYAGTTTVAAVQALDLGLSGLPIASQPSFKVNDPLTKVDIAVTVSDGGLIERLALSWTLDQPGENSHWEYSATYRDLGTAAAIEAPDPGHTVTTDYRFGGDPAGDM
jgi:hypothetical protein